MAGLLAAAGRAAATRAALDRLALPERAQLERARLGAVIDGLAAAMPSLKVTVDLVENRGFEYHTGISFTFFARVDPALAAGRARSRRALRGGRSGRAGAGDRVYALHRHDPANAVAAAGAAPAARAARRRPRPRPRPARRRLDHGGGPAPGGGLAGEARRLDCGFVLSGGEPRPV